MFVQQAGATMKRATAVAAVAAVLAAGIGVLPKVGGAQVAAPAVGLLDQRLQGKAALAAVRAKGVLAQVAAKVERTEADVAAILDTDSTAGVDQSGQMFFVEPVAPSIPSAGSSPISRAAPSVSQAPFPYTQTFLLHSRPGSARVIYLDFDGYTSSSSTPGVGWGTRVGTPYDTDSSPATFSNAEQDQIQSVWQRMAEDFAPFDIDVTTEDPGLAAIDRSGPADLNYGTTVAFSNTVTPPVCSGCGGVAYLNVFGITSNHQDYQPAWVLPLGVPGGKNMAEAGSHEAGHNFGLNHDACGPVAAGSCPANQGYYGGHANWGPLMGVGYYHPVSQWSKGEYLGANNTEDDVAKISVHGPLVADEPNSSVATATDLGTLTTPQTASGLIGATGDADFFKFTVSAPTSVKIGAKPVAVGPNLDLKLTLLNAAGAVVGVASPVSGETNNDTPTGLDASVSYFVTTPGTYYVSVAADATDPSGDTGYSLYGSLGRYTVTVEESLVGDTFKAVPVQRLLDTRNDSPITTAGIRDLVVVGRAGVPTNATSVALNIAAVVPAGTGHLRVFPTGTTLPLASVVNFKGRNTPNHVIAKVGAGGKISIYAGITANVIVDINGYFVDDASGNRYMPVATPAQIASVTIPGSSSVDVPVVGQGGIAASGVVSAVLNVAALNPSAAGHLRVFPAGTPVPNASTNNFAAGDSRMNLVLVEVGASGSISVFNAASGPVTVTVDSVGYFGSTGARFKPVDPIRTLDSRLPTGALPVAPGAFEEVQIRGFGGVPNLASVTAVAVNVAAVSPVSSGAIDVGPSGVSPTLNSVLHPAAENVANLVMVPIGADGKIRLVNNSAGTTHMIVDIMGFFTS
jgi:hypothetical protein